MEGKTLPVTHVLRRQHGFMKSIAAVVLVAFVSLYLQPLAVAAQLPPAAPAAKPAPASNEEKLARTLESIEDRLGKFEDRLARKEDATREKDELKRLRQNLDDLDRQALADFEKIGKHLKDKNLPKVILDRHAEAVATYKAEMEALKANVDDIETAPKDEDRKLKAKKAKEHLKAKQKKRAPKTRFDPNDLPNKRLEANPKNKPKLKKEEFERAALFSNPSVQVAALGDFTYDRLPGASDPAYLATTTEVVLTDAIKAKALELGHDPVKIYQWVRNNVEWLPTFGSAQDADVTLGSRRGNSFDIASLTVALLRASGIPARYVHGAIEVPEDKFRNWAGGFNSISAAADYASSGGIPIAGVVSGGKITKVQMEHVWVEAAIDFRPSRGAINKAADTWVQLDPSYKQYEFLQGLDVVAISGLDPTALAQSFASSGTVNEAEGWVQNLNPTILQNAQTQAQTALESYIKNNMTNPTVGDVIGGKKIIAQTASVLPAALPYRSLILGARYGKIPAALQNTYALGFGIDVLGDVNVAASFPLARVNNHKLTLSFRPSTAADEQALASLLPEGPITDPSQLPSSIPSYLISVTPEIALEGQVVAQGTPMRLGEDLQLVFQVSLVNSSPLVKTYEVPAGSYLSLSANQGSVSLPGLRALRAELIRTKTKLESNDPALIGSLSREDVLGDMLHVGTLEYWSQYIEFARIISLADGTRHNLASGFGSLGYEPNVDYFFGFPRAIKTGGVAVNIWVADVNASSNGDTDKRRSFQLRVGMLSSALEHAIPEQMFSVTTYPVEGVTVEGVSAVKALQIAASQGQRVYHITSANQAQVLPNLHLDGLAMQEIVSALAAGKEVIAHTDRVTVTGWTGEGYIMFDPVTGAGAYKITGGANGGTTSWCDVVVIAIVAIVIIALLAALIAVLLGGLPALAAAGAFVVEMTASIAAYISAAVTALPLAFRAVAAASLMGLVSAEAAAGDDNVAHCTRLYVRCIQERWGGDWSCGDCQFYCTGINQEWPFEHYSPDKKFCR